MKNNILFLLISAPVIFSIFFLACRLFSCYILPVVSNYKHKKMNTTKLRKLIQETKGKFFSCSFIKNDGSLRVANGKDFYRRLLASSSSPKAGWNPLAKTSFEPFVDRNKEAWIAASDERLVSFKCGKIEVTF
jgi:hypothetical protein